MKICCDKFSEKYGKYNVGFEFYEGWHVNGCCGGGCYVLSDILFCPFCGSRLPVSDEEREVPDDV
jgi:hypothetical protein